MEKITTLNQLLATEKSEEAQVRKLEEPSEATIQFILNYSKAVEVQGGAISSDYPMVLN